MGSGDYNAIMLGVTVGWTSIPFWGRIAIFVITSCYRNQSYMLALMGHLVRKQTLPYLHFHNLHALLEGREGEP